MTKSLFLLQFIVSAAPYNAIPDETSKMFIKYSNITQIFHVVGWTVQVGQPQSAQNRTDRQKYERLLYSAGNSR